MRPRPRSWDEGRLGEATNVRQIQVFIVLWVVTFLLEGAARKWLPGTTAPLYAARDAVTAIVAAYATITYGRTNRAIRIGVIVVCFIVASLAALQLGLGQMSAPVAILGVRGYIAPLLLLVVVRPALLRKTLVAVSVALAIGAAINLLLVAVQASSPVSAFINQTTDVNVSAIVNPGDVVRGSGTFTAAAGLSAFLSLSIAVHLWAVFAWRGRMQVLASFAVVCEVATTALSGSRSNLLTAAIAIVVWAIVSASTRTARRSLLALVLLLVVSLATIFSAFPDVVNSFSDRIDLAAGNQDPTDRLVQIALSGIAQTPSLLGDGIGTHSNAAIGQASSLGWIEDDGARTVAEMGALGWLGALARIFASIALVAVTVHSRKSSRAALIILSVLDPFLLWGQIIQLPTQSGAFSLLLLFWADAVGLLDPEVEQRTRS